MMLLPIYRDHIVPESEVGFLRRQYLGFSRMQPVWVGRRITPAAPQLPGSVLQLGGPGLLGPLARVAFKAWGRVPPLPPAWQPPLVRVVHAQFARGGVLALPLARRLGVPLVVTLHGGDISKRTGHRALNLLAMRFPQLVAGAARFVCVSGHIAAVAAARGVPEAKLTVLPIGSELAETMPPPPAAPDYHLFVGRFVEKKGLPVLAEALRRLRAAGDRTRLVCVGDGPLRPLLQALATEVGGVELTGWLPPAEVRARMAGAWSLLVPSVTARDGDTEGLPSVIPEAMALGCPIIGSSHPAVTEGFAPGLSGLVVPEGDGAALAEAMLALNADPTRRHALGQAARLFATERLNARHQSAALEDLLLKVAAG